MILLRRLADGILVFCLFLLVDPIHWLFTRSHIDRHEFLEQIRPNSLRDLDACCGLVARLLL